MARAAPAQFDQMFGKGAAIGQPGERIAIGEVERPGLAGDQFARGLAGAGKDQRGEHRHQPDQEREPGNVRGAGAACRARPAARRAACALPVERRETPVGKACGRGYWLKCKGVPWSRVNSPSMPRSMNLAMTV